MCLLIIKYRPYMIGPHTFEAGIYVDLDYPSDINAAVTRQGVLFISYEAAKLPLELQQAMLAHELGHKALHLSGALKGRYVKEEIEADIYGAGLVGIDGMLSMLKFLVQEHGKLCSNPECTGLLECHTRIKALEEYRAITSD